MKLYFDKLLWKIREKVWNTSSETLSYIWETTKEPTWFVDRNSSVLWIDTVNKTLYIEPNTAWWYSYFDVYVKGNKYTFYTRQEVVVPNVSWLYLMYIDEYGTFNIIDMINITEDIFTNTAFVCCAYYDATSWIFLSNSPWDERHWVVMDWATHYNLHKNVWTFVVKNPDWSIWWNLTWITVDWDWTTDTDISWGKEAIKIADEDIIIDIPELLSTDNKILLYLEWWVWKKVVNQYWLTNTWTWRLAYNDVSVEWSEGLQEVSNWDFVLIHHFSSNCDWWTHFCVLWQNIYTTKTKAREGAKSEMNNLLLKWLPSPEIVATHTVIYQTKDTYTNTHKARIVSTDTGDDFIDWRLSKLNYTWWTSNVKSFLWLEDTPTDYTWQAGKVVSVKSDESWLEFSSWWWAEIWEILSYDWELVVWTLKEIQFSKDTTLNWIKATLENIPSWTASATTILDIEKYDSWTSSWSTILNNVIGFDDLTPTTNWIIIVDANLLTTSFLENDRIRFRITQVADNFAWSNLKIYFK